MEWSADNIHHAEIKAMEGVMYYNDGDWVESCTARIEYLDGHLGLGRWGADDLPAGSEADLPPATATT